MKKVSKLLFIAPIMLSLFACSKNNTTKKQSETNEINNKPVISIGENGNWFIDGVDTYQKASGSDGISIIDFKLTKQEGLDCTYTITLSNGLKYDFVVSNGSNGISIESFELTKQEGLESTYTITLSNGVKKDFTVTNGKSSVQYYPVVFRDIDGSFLDADFVEEGSSATYRGKELTFTTNKAYSYRYNGWDKEFDSITGPTTITATVDETRLFLGSYPQSLEKDNEIVNSLNSIAGSNPSSTDTFNWSVYDYSDKVTYYQDVDLDNDGSYDYRGVYFTDWRQLSYGNQSDNGYKIGRVYWFKYEPVEWHVVNRLDNKIQLLSYYILDSQYFYPSTSQAEFEHNGKVGYTNNYELSHLRKFLTKYFYNWTFNNKEKATILLTEVDNSEGSTERENSYACDNTFDYVFALSCSEVTHYGLASDEYRIGGTDYAKSQGLHVNAGYSWWWLRSPAADNGEHAYYVNTSYGYNCYYFCDDAWEGIRPSVWIKL